MHHLYKLILSANVPLPRYLFVEGMRKLFATLALVCTGMVAGAASLHPFDSIAVVRTAQNQYTIHKVSQGESLSTIAKKYGVSLADLKAANPGVGDKLALKQVLKVPNKAMAKGVKPQTAGSAKPVAPKPVQVDKPAIDRNTRTSQTDKPAPASGQTHTVQKGESLYSIAKKYQVSIADLKAWNHLNNDALKAGQTIVIMPGVDAPKGKQQTASTEEAPTQKATETPKEQPSRTMTQRPALENSKPINHNTTETEEVAAPGMPEPATARPSTRREDISSSSFKMMREETWATVGQESELNPDRKYALHRTAPIGTIVKLKNKENNKMVFVKVVGRLTGDDGEVKMHISRSAADQLGGGDRIHVDSSYGLSN